MHENSEDHAPSFPAAPTTVPSRSPSGQSLLQRFPHLAAKFCSNANTQQKVLQDGKSVVMKYMLDLRNFGASNVDNALEFWGSQHITYPELASLAEDVISAPASEAFVERIFSVCGTLTSGQRNRTSTMLEQRVFLKMNRKLVE
jgi:hypothetical protein